MKTLSSYLDSHFKESFTIDEVGMKLIPEQNSRIKARLESLEQRAPAISSINLKFTNEETQIFGELTISGAGRKFYSKTKGQNPLEVYKSLEQDVDKQLMQWKKTRFLDKCFGPSISNAQEQLTGGYAL